MTGVNQFARREGWNKAKVFAKRLKKKRGECEGEEEDRTQDVIRLFGDGSI